MPKHVARPLDLQGAGVILDGSDQGNAGFLEHRYRRFEAVALMRLEVGHMLHAGLNPLRHEESLLFG